MNNKIEKKLLNLVNRAFNQKEVPVAAVVVCNNKIISSAYNKVEKNKDITAHAEILAIRKAAKKLKTWRLTDCELYVTLEPCDMCKRAIETSRIKEVFYYVDKDFKKSFQTKFTKNYQSGYLDIYSEKLKVFFKKMRN